MSCLLVQYRYDTVVCILHGQLLWHTVHIHPYSYILCLMFPQYTLVLVIHAIYTIIYALYGAIYNIVLLIDVFLSLRSVCAAVAQPLSNMKYINNNNSVARGPYLPTSPFVRELHLCMILKGKVLALTNLDLQIQSLTSLLKHLTALMHPKISIPKIQFTSFSFLAHSPLSHWEL